jgi:hypothetical protein
VMRNDAVQAAVVFVDGLVAALTVAIEGTFNPDSTNTLRTQTYRGSEEFIAQAYSELVAANVRRRTVDCKGFVFTARPASTTKIEARTDLWGIAFRNSCPRQKVLDTSSIVRQTVEPAAFFL